MLVSNAIVKEEWMKLQLKQGSTRNNTYVTINWYSLKKKMNIARWFDLAARCILLNNGE